ncbi:hypothetical protein LWF15_19325 [Kineosporia rhizophila]|uniref:hypothetical protein n=1 Tax=Kineosporia TaxID=49184 RepID=UPI000A6BADBC|nr:MULTISPECIES: hypothetical protein [Kineosporia]MCE0537645.1 hypothetical protein [Kineosporia rhizophila]GLY18840.1 hypothetical protein Kisp01_58540 [Kineosporia sp. NBRC 101677]
MARSVVVLLAVAGLAACATSTSENAGCARPGLLVSIREAVPGDSLEVQGESFLSECGDTIANGRAAESKGMTRPIRLFLVQGETRIDVGEAQADIETGAFATTVTLPPGAVPGPATLETSVKDSGAAEIDILAR